MTLMTETNADQIKPITPDIKDASSRLHELNVLDFAMM